MYYANVSILVKAIANLFVPILIGAHSKPVWLQLGDPLTFVSFSMPEEHPPPPPLPHCRYHHCAPSEYCVCVFVCVCVCRCGCVYMCACVVVCVCVCMCGCVCVYVCVCVCVVMCVCNLLPACLLLLVSLLHNPGSEIWLLGNC